MTRLKNTLLSSNEIQISNGLADLKGIGENVSDQDIQE